MRVARFVLLQAPFTKERIVATTPRKQRVGQIIAFAQETRLLARCFHSKDVSFQTTERVGTITKPVARWVAVTIVGTPVTPVAIDTQTGLDHLRLGARVGADRLVPI